MLQTKRPSINRSQRAVSRSVPAPVGGWNARDALASMKPEDAVTLENFFPKQSEVVTRSGSVLHCDTGEGTHTVKTLAEFKTGTTRKLVAGCNGKLINVTTSTPSTIGSGFSSDAWRWVNFGNKIFFVNGTDAPQDWDGTTLTATAWSGVGLTITNLSDVVVFKERMFFIEKNTLNFWYGAAVKTITGALTKFPLQYVGNFGGVLQGIGTITEDGGAGSNDLLALYLSSGEVIIYSGSDPGSSSAWSLVGRFNIGALINAPPIQFGSDLISINRGAYVPLTKIIPFGRSNPSSLDLSDKISGEVVEKTRLYGDNNGWQALLFPGGRKLIFNVPLSSTIYTQHVMNVDTHAWCKFTGWNFYQFALFNDLLYAGGTDGKVYQCDTGTDDNGTEINASLQTAWNYFGSPDREKAFSMMRVIFTCVIDPNALMTSGVDFEIGVPNEAITMEDAGSLGAVWDIDEWNLGQWSGTTRTMKGWNGTTGVGYCFSLAVSLTMTEQVVSMQAFNVTFQPGGLT